MSKPMTYGEAQQLAATLAHRRDTDAGAPDAETLKHKLKPHVEAAMLATHRKESIRLSLDAALDVIVQLRATLRQYGGDFTSGDRQALATTLEQMARMCFTVARECERTAQPVQPGEGR